MGIRQRITHLVSRFNEPVVPREHLERWLNQFSKEDRVAALTLLEKIEFHSYPRLVRECRELHGKLKEDLFRHGFDSQTFADVDFTREFTCKSGDIISYIYRRSNCIPTVDFKNFDRLVARTCSCPDEYCNRALVILDDYTGTGSQFIFMFVASNEADIGVLNSYRRIYLASIAIHDNALEKLALLKEGEFEKVLAIEESQFPFYDWAVDQARIMSGLTRVDWTRVEFVWAEREHSLLSPENTSLTSEEREMIEKFLSTHGGDSTLTTSFLAGHHTFFYGAPNSLPKILFPLFSRVEDVSIYPTEHFLGVSTDIVNWSMENTDRPSK